MVELTEPLLLTVLFYGFGFQFVWSGISDNVIFKISKNEFTDKYKNTMTDNKSDLLSISSGGGFVFSVDFARSVSTKITLD